VSDPKPAAQRDALRDAIAREESRLDRLEAERSALRSRLVTLRAELASLEDPGRLPEDPGSGLPAVPETPEEKIRLFRSLFRGRTDVFPTRFVSKRTGRAGYAPACRNKFVPSVCELPKVKCGDCPNQGFVPFDDEAVLEHLTGKQVMGLYPLLEDDTCWLLAADFDKKAWTDDVTAFVETCRLFRESAGRGEGTSCRGPDSDPTAP
jgi:hypothetical protein